MIRVLVLDDQPVVADGTAAVLRDAGFDVVGVATTMEDAVATAVTTLPDVIVCDVMLAGEPLGLDLPSRLSETPAQNAAVLFLSSFTAPWFQARAVKEGGSGYLSKSGPSAELVAGVRTAAAGGVVFRRDALRVAITYQPPTERERQIIALAATGASNGEIGTRLGLTDKTVESYLARLYERYRVATRAQLAMHALREGWIPDQARG